MKALILVVVFICSACLAQTVSTNWVTAAPNFREVGGRLYNIDQSTNFVKMRVRMSVFRGGLAYGETLKITYLGLQHGKDVCFTNWPAIPIDTQTEIKAMRIGVSSRGFELWDCGAPHVVAVIKTNFHAPSPQ